MKRILLGIVLCCALAACSRWSNDDEIFMQTYTEVIIAREQFLDSNQANKRVAEVLKQHGFTEFSFRQRFQELAGKPERLRQILDSARNRARRIGEQEQKQEQKQHPQQEKKQEIQNK
ncbi:MAG: hypothetical protein EAZ92_08360 [Candidatus Kapaibacterium sp.]|nr:MAG: hypothetical protein EAZ92_08360 [Candidatus Kapabacteria bacterium]